MAIDTHTRLKRFRRVALTHDIALPETGMLAEREIEHLRAQLNASIYIEAEPWMVPSWVDLTLKGLDKEESLITELPNNSYRNWSLIGGVGSKKYGMTDSRGLVTAVPSCGSIDFWVLGSEGIIFPALMGKDETQLTLVSPEDQLYEWRTDVQSVEFARLLYHAKQDDVEYLFNEVVLKNIALEETSLTFYAVIRPMTVLGFEPIEKLEFDAKTNQLSANESIALQTDVAPSAIYLVEANDTTIPEIIQSDAIRYDYKIDSKGGLGTAVLRFNITLSPAGTRTIVFASPLEPTSEMESAPIGALQNQNRDQTIGNWYDFTEKRGVAQFPDERLNGVLSQAAVSLAIQSQSVLFPEESDNRTLSWINRMRVLYALIKSGGIDVASQITNQAVHIFGESKVSMDTSIFSPLLWGLLQLQGYSIQKESIQQNIEYLIQLAKGLVTSLEVDRPRKRVIEHTSNEPYEFEDTPLEHYRLVDASIFEELNDLLWNLSALRESQSYFALTQVDLVAKIKDTIPLVEERIQKKLGDIESARWPRSNDPQMYDIDRAILDVLTSIVQLKIHDIDLDFLRNLCKKVSARRLVRNLWKTSELSESLSSHLALRISQFHVWDKNRDAAEPLLQRALEFLSEDFLLPELVNPRTFGGGGGEGSSVLAAADLVLLLSDMLVLEEKNNLVFLAGIPSEWFMTKKPLTIKGLHTKFGKTNIDIGLSANQHQIETGMENLPDEIEVHVPESVPLRMVKAYGGSIVDRAVRDRSPHIKIVPLSNDVVLTYHR